jgi:hypothetical protein
MRKRPRTAAVAKKHRSPQKTDDGQRFSFWHFEWVQQIESAGISIACSTCWARLRQETFPFETVQGSCVGGDSPLRRGAG